MFFARFGRFLGLFLAGLLVPKWPFGHIVFIKFVKIGQKYAKNRTTFHKGFGQCSKECRKILTFATFVV